MRNRALGQEKAVYGLGRKHGVISEALSPDTRKTA